MYLKAVRAQIKFLMGQKQFAIVFLALLALMLLNFTQNVLDFRGYDVISMYHPMKLLTLSYNKAVYESENALLLVQLVPLLVCLPAALSLAQERQTGQAVLIAARLGGKIYLWSKAVAVFVVTMAAFSLPFLLEILLNCISFPLAATGDFFNASAYARQRLVVEAFYQMAWLYRLSPYLYAVAGTLIFGCFAGLLAAATVTLSALVRMRFQVLLMLPAFLLLQITAFLGENGSTSWFRFLMIFNGESRNTPFFFALVLALLGFTLAGTAIATKKDWLS